MKQIRLTKGKHALVDDEDFDRINQFKWCASKSNAHREIYYAVRGTYTKEKVISRSMHREILGLTDGKIEVDHIDGNGLNNQRVNLRLSDSRHNSFNRGANRNNTSGIKGVSWNKEMSKWVAQITIDGRQTYLGLFDDKHEAGEAYLQAAIKHHGEFAHA